MSSKIKYIPLHDSGNSVRIHLPSNKIVTCIVSIQFFSFIFCIIWSILYNFEDSTSTHCHVYNFLPSISAAIGSYTPQRYVWNTAITLALFPRLCVAFLYQKLYTELLIPKASSLKNFAAIHKTCFLTFIATSEIYMILTCLLLRTSRNKPLTKKQSRSLNYKWRCLIINIISFMIAGYFFVRHNTYCEPGVYSLFALSEYIVVLTNIAFHITAALDFSNVVLTLGKISVYFS